jgi:hypothetical protein
MKTPQISVGEPLQLEEQRQGTESQTEGDEIRAWQPMEGDLWIPFRIRGSWRGGVLG